MMNGRIYLDKITREDLATTLKWSNDLDFMALQSTGVLRPVSIEDEIRWFEDMPKHVGNVFNYNVRTKQDNILIGFTLFYRYDPRNRSASIGIGIAEPNYRDKGYGTEAMRLMVEYGFNELNLNRVGLTVSGFNARAIHVYQKLGFKEEGILRQSYFGDGKYHDIWVMGLLRDEWANLSR
jgi:RimJ/RimL family protein N-acetyltransferase